MTRKRSAVLTAGIVLGLLAPAATASAVAKPVKSPNLIKDAGAESAKPTGDQCAPTWCPFRAGPA